MKNKFSTNESTRIITGHVIYNPAYTYKFQLKTTKVEDKNPIDLQGNTPIHYAVQNGQLETASYLLKKCDNENPPNYNGETLLHLAAKRGYSGLLLNLFKKAKDKSPADVFGQTPLHYACNTGQVR